MAPADMKPFARVTFPGPLGHLVYELRYPHGPRRGWTLRLVNPAPINPSEFYATRRMLKRAQLAPCNPVTVKA